MASVHIEKPRIFQSSKDMFLSLGVLLVAMFLMVGFTGLCSVNPGTPEAEGPVTRVDAESALRMEARALDFPIRYPQMPQDWVPNSQRRTQVGRQISVVTGWVIGGDKFISLTQTPAPLKDAQHPDDAVREQVRTETIDGHKWMVFEGEGARPLWITDLGDVRLLLEPLASDDVVRQVARAATQAQPLG